MSDGTKRVIALGFFDGVHVGHGALLKAAVAEAKRLGATSCVMSFDRHPGAAVTGKPVPMINSNQDRVWIMEHYYGIEEVILAEFNEHMMHQPWDAFVEDYLVGELGAVCVITGSDNRFGARGHGNPDRLREKCAQLGIGCLGRHLIGGTGGRAFFFILSAAACQYHSQAKRRSDCGPSETTHTLSSYLNFRLLL